MRNNKSNKGFTLIELLIVIAIIGILAAVLIPNLLNARQTAFNTSAQSCARTIVAAAEVYRIEASTFDYTGFDWGDVTTYDSNSCEGINSAHDATTAPSITVAASGATYTSTVGHPQGSVTYEVTQEGFEAQP